MIFLLLKLVMLGLAYKLYLMKKEPYFCALAFSIPLAISGVIMANPLLGVFIGSAILFALAFACFWLMQKLPQGKPEYIVLGITALILSIVI